MGERQIFQPLTREDAITVVLYRIGIVLSTIMISGLAYLLMAASSNADTAPLSSLADILAFGLYASVGMSVFFIHLYVGKFKIYLKNLYYLSLGCLVMLFFIGDGSLANAVLHEAYSRLLLLPLCGCLGFVTAKEAFCFKLLEGYILAIGMPVYLILVSGNIISPRGASYGLVLIAAMLVIFMLRKVFMPIPYDIGDKSAYQ